MSGPEDAPECEEDALQVIEHTETLDRIEFYTDYCAALAEDTQRFLARIGRKPID